MVCPYCTSMYVKKDGKKFNKGSTNQKFKCNSCSKNFSVPFETSIPDEFPSIKPGEIFTIKSKEKLRIHCLTDIHVGAVEFDLKKFKEAVRMIKKDRNARWYGNGDLLELIPPGYKAINQ